MIAFVHIPKTAGTTLNSILAGVYRPGERHEIMMRGMSWILPKPTIVRRPLISLSKIRRLKSAVRTHPGPRLIHGHFDLSIAKYFPPDARFFTLLRDPVERAISHYYHYRRRVDDRIHPLAMRSSLAEWVSDRGIVEMDNGQTRRLAGEMNLPCGRVTAQMLERAMSRLARFAVVGLTERFDQSLLLLQRAFGWEVQAVRAQNVGGNRPPRTEVSEEALGTIERCNRLDQELYRFAAELFEKAMCGIDDTAMEVVKEAAAVAG